MKVFVVQLDGSSQWVAVENIKAAFSFIDGNTPLDTEPIESIFIEEIAETEWDKDWISDEDKPGRTYSIRKAMEEVATFPCLLASEE